MPDSMLVCFRPEHDHVLRRPQVFPDWWHSAQDSQAEGGKLHPQHLGPADELARFAVHLERYKSSR